MPAPQCFYGAEPIFFGGPLRTAALLPKLMREGGDVLLLGFVSASAGAGSLMLALCAQVSLIGMLQRLSGAFMSGQVVFFSVALGAATMRMRGAALLLSRYLL